MIAFHTGEDENLESLYARLRTYCKDVNINTDISSEGSIFMDDFRDNLTSVICDIVASLHLQPVSKVDFDSVIENYNRRNRTNLQYSYFLEKGFVQNILDEIVIPNEVRHHLSTIIEKKRNKKEYSLPEDMKDVLECMTHLLDLILSRYDVLIDETTLNNIFKYNNSNLTIKDLIDKQVIESNEKGYCYRENWSHGIVGNHHTKVVALLWLKIVETNNTKEAFIHFIKRVNKHLRGWTRGLSQYLSKTSLMSLQGYCIEILSTEDDLTDIGKEGQKYFLDYPLYRQFSIPEKIPTLDFSSEDPFELISKVRFYRHRFQSLWDLTTTRTVFSLLVNLVIELDDLRRPYYLETKNLLKGIRRPFIVYKTISKLRQHFPEAIPFLLDDPATIPCAFYALTKLQTKNQLFSKNVNRRISLEKPIDYLDEIWTDAFCLVLKHAASSKEPEKYSKAIAQVLNDLAASVFTLDHGPHEVQLYQHETLRRRYEKVLRLLGNYETNATHFLNGLKFHPKIIHVILPKIISEVISIKELPNVTGFLDTKNSKIDLCIELLKLCDSALFDKNYQNNTEKLSQGRVDILAFLYNHLANYFTQTEIEVFNFTETSETKTPTRGVSDFGLEIVEWGYLFCWFQKEGKILHLCNTFKDSIALNKDEDSFDTKNREEKPKIKTFARILMHAFIGIEKQKNTVLFSHFDIPSTLLELEGIIGELCVKYSMDMLSEGRIDVFEDRFMEFSRNIYKIKLTALFFQCLNFFTGDPKEIIARYFEGSIDLGRMLTAINYLESPILRKFLIDKIEEIKTDDFIDSRFTATELENAVIEAVNSDNHFSLADPIVEKLERHFESIKGTFPDGANFIYKIKLFLAFRKRDIQLLTGIKEPERQFANERINPNDTRLKRFYIALFTLYNNKNYSSAAEELEQLVSEESENIEFAIHFYKARFLNEADAGSDYLQTKTEWEDFLSKNEEKKNSELNNFIDHIESIKLLIAIRTNNTSIFDHAVTSLSKSFLYDEHLIPLIYEYYRRREMPDLAYIFICNSTLFFEQKGIAIPEAINEIKIGAIDDKLLLKLKGTLGTIPNFDSRLIPQILPQGLNGQYKLKEFVLVEIISALKIMRKKIKAVASIKNENRFNDVLICIMKQRLIVWGWQISDQERSGISLNKSEAGEVDFLIKSSKEDVALMEAMVYSQRSYPKVAAHIQKIASYSRDINMYYMIIYYTGKPQKFKEYWEKYQTDALKVPYSGKWTLDLNHGFNIKTAPLGVPDEIEIGQTLHGKEISLLHIFINMNETA